jgi:hypothetical protein
VIGSIELSDEYSVLDELDDDALSDGGEDEMTPEQQGLSQITNNF